MKLSVYRSQGPEYIWMHLFFENIHCKRAYGSRYFLKLNKTSLRLHNFTIAVIESLPPSSSYWIWFPIHFYLFSRKPQQCCYSWNNYYLRLTKLSRSSSKKPNQVKALGNFNLFRFLLTHFLTKNCLGSYMKACFE